MTNKEKFKQLPLDKNNNPIPLVPPGTAVVAAFRNTAVTTNQSITINAATGYIRFYVEDETVLLKWGTTDTTTSNFDEVLPPGLTDLAIPKDLNGNIHTACKIISDSGNAAKVWAIQK